jgi:outer membrane protein
MRPAHLAFALCLSLAGVAVATVPAGAQPAATAPAPRLTLAEALAMARRSNPVLANATNARRTAAAQLRSATGAFLPSVNTSAGTGFREGRQTFFQGQGFGSTNDQLSTDAAANASLQLSVATFADRGAAKAGVEATEADIEAAEQRLRTDVTTQFITALQAEARAVLQDSLRATTLAQLELARARLQVGSGTQLDVQRAEVADGQQRVAALNARNQAEIEKVRLFQQIGVPPVLGTVLDPNLPDPPALALEQLLDMARKGNPQLEASRYRLDAARKAVTSARSSYFPSLSLSAAVSGFTNRFTDTDALIRSGQASAVNARASCIRTEEVRAALGLSNQLAQCDLIAFTPAAEQAIRDQQAKYPFDFTRNPYSFSATFSLPLFNGFRREQAAEQAAVQRRNAENDVRAQELRLTADVSTAYLSFTTAQQALALQAETVRTARTALALAQERYRAGLTGLVELVQARGDYERAETDRITALYDVQRAFTALEAAVGRPLR